MVDIKDYIRQLTDLLKQKFDSRLLYVGLQGSYLRGEATPNSDIDIMVVIDGLGIADMDAYRSIIESLSHFDKSCGSICAREDLANWNPLEIGHLLNTTKDYYGLLRDFVPGYTQQDIRNFIKLSLNNLYHEICHRYIHAGRDLNMEALPGSYKGVFFILQNLYYLRHGVFAATKAELLELLEGRDRAVLERALELNRGIPHEFADSFELLFAWCQESLKSIG